MEKTTSQDLMEQACERYLDELENVQKDGGDICVQHVASARRGGNMVHMKMTAFPEGRRRKHWNTSYPSRAEGEDRLQERI